MNLMCCDALMVIESVELVLDSLNSPNIGAAENNGFHITKQCCKICGKRLEVRVAIRVLDGD